VTPWRAIIFDLDDTLYAERDYVLSGFRAVARWAEAALGIPAAPGYAALERLFAQGVRGDTFNTWLAAHHAPTGDGENKAESATHSASIVAQMVEVYREHTPQLAPFPEVPPLLERLATSYRLGLVSDGYLAVQQRKWAALGLERFFGAVVFSDELGREHWKPSPRPFEIVTARLGVPPEAAVYVADNPHKDFLGARRAGLGAVWLRRPDGEYTTHEPATPDHAPTVTIAELAELEPWLSELGRRG
jgi:putative hydrolase of the HAD superfamily